jgi:hypothetical protein
VPTSLTYLFDVTNDEQMDAEGPHTLHKLIHL